MQPELKLNTFKLILSAAAIMMIGWLISAGYLLFAVDQTAKQEALKSAQTSAKQAALSIQPFILANDIISLNVYINSLTEARLINGVAVFNENDALIARAGTENGATKEITLGSTQTPMGHVTLFISHQPQKTMLESLLFPMALLSITTIFATLIGLWLNIKQQAAQALKKKIEAQPKPIIIIEDFGSSENEPTTDTPVPVSQTPTESSTAFESTLNDVLNTQTPDNNPISEGSISIQTEETAPATEPTPTVTISVVEDTLPIEAPVNPDTPSPAELSPAKIEAPITLEAPITSTDEEMDNEALVELLRPDAQSKQRMPQFVPAPLQPEKSDKDELEINIFDDEPEQAAAKQIFIEDKPEPEVVTEKSNPLRDRARPEVQLDLYTLEHQLELTLQPSEAAYLLYIDATTGHADYVEPDEHEFLLDTYESMIRQVASIYGGQLTVLASGDLQLVFDDQAQDDSHGIHATCAAKLFTLLYRAFNHKRIKSFSPVLNLHMAIVRGNRNKPSLIKEEALFLTRTTQSNELISHTSLTEARHLKETIMMGADIRREDEDKVLILSLGESYQLLLKKQADHLLAKT
jgi:hypothetical protein